MKERIRIGIRLLAIFFAFGASMCALTIVLLLFPGGALDRLWTLNPEARSSFQSMGGMSVLLMGAVGVACAGGCNWVGARHELGPTAGADHSSNQPHW